MDAQKGIELLLTPGLTALEWEQIALAMTDAGAGKTVDIASVTGRLNLTPVPPQKIARQVRAMTRAGARLLCCWEPDYPGVLRGVAAAPPALFVRGRLAGPGDPVVAIVGTRKPSVAGRAFAYRLAKTLSLLGVVVVSGLARGIDTAAHTGALDAGGMTVAVLGTGVDVVYPPENGPLMDRIAATGGIVSEQLCGMQAFAYVFPRRNRIISGLSDAVVVVEGGARSGALITARWALDQGRDVGAVPGFPGDFRSAGPNQLLKQGAFVVEDAVDVITNVKRLAERVRLQAIARSADTGEGLEGDMARVYDLVSTGASVDEVAGAAGITIEHAQSLLSVLEIDGRIRRDDAGNYARSGWTT